MLRSGKVRDWLLLLLCNFIWASQFVMVKLVQRHMGPGAATFFPMTIAAGLLAAFLAARRARRTPVRWRDAGQFIMIGLLGQAAAQLLITWGVRYAPASNAALLMLALPVTTAVMAYFILGERM